MFIPNLCDCSCDPPLYTPQPNFYQCPPPPPIPHCRCDDQGNPIWYEKHPLVPMAMDLACGLPSCLSEDELICHMRLAETIYSPCRLPGHSYYQAIIFHAYAMGEYIEELELYKQARHMSLAIGEKSDIKKPTIYDGLFGMQLKSLLDNTPKLPTIITC